MYIRENDLPSMVLEGGLEPSLCRSPKKNWDLNRDKLLYGQPTLVLKAFLQNNEFSLKGYALCGRSSRIGCCVGQRHAERMLKSHQYIPVEWREYKLLFMGTVWGGCRSDYYIPYLVWGKKGWRIDWACLNERFNVTFRLVCEEDTKARFAQPESDGDVLMSGMEVRSMHVGGGQLWDGPGPVDGAPGAADGQYFEEDDLYFPEK